MSRKSVIIDANVWIDYFLPIRSNSEDARRFINEACRRNATLFYPVHCLKDVFYLLSNTLKAKQREATGFVSIQSAQAVNTVVWSCVDSLCDGATAVGADQSDVEIARKYRSICSDLENNFVMAAAERAQADFIVTSDKKLLRASTVPAYTPADAIAYLQLDD